MMTDTTNTDISHGIFIFKHGQYSFYLGNEQAVCKEGWFYIFSLNKSIDDATNKNRCGVCINENTKNLIGNARKQKVATDLLQQIKEVFVHVEKLKGYRNTTGKKILINCEQGRNRSVFIMMLILKHYNKTDDWDKSLQLIKEKVKVGNHQDNILRSTHEFWKYLFINFDNISSVAEGKKKKVKKKKRKRKRDAEKITEHLNNIAKGLRFLKKYGTSVKTDVVLKHTEGEFTISVTSSKDFLSRNAIKILKGNVLVAKTDVFLKHTNRAFTIPVRDTSTKDFLSRQKNEKELQQQQHDVFDLTLRQNISNIEKEPLTLREVKLEGRTLKTKGSETIFNVSPPGNESRGMKIKFLCDSGAMGGTQIRKRHVETMGLKYIPDEVVTVCCAGSTHECKLVYVDIKPNNSLIYCKELKNVKVIVVPDEEFVLFGKDHMDQIGLNVAPAEKRKRRKQMY